MTTENLQVSASNCDADELSGTMALTGPYTRLYNVNWKNGWRWVPGATIPQGATVDSATLSIKCIGTSYDTFYGDVHAEDAAGPGAFTTGASDISNRTLTTASVNVDTVDGGVDWITFDVASIIEELVGDYDVTSIVFVLVCDAIGVGRVKAFDTYPSDAVKLDVVYSLAGQPAILRTQGVPTGAGTRNRPGGWN